MAGGGVADFVGALHNGVQRRVVADGGVGAVQVVVDGAGQADHREVELVGKDARAGERAVAADDDDGVDAVAACHVVGQLAAFGGLELLAARRLEDGAAALDDVGDVLGVEVNDFVGDEAAVAAVNALDLETVENCGAGDRADGGVHSRRIASRGEDADGLDF